MAKRKKYLPSKESERVTWLNNFALKLGTYQVLLNIDPTDVTAAQQAAVFYAYIIGRIESTKDELSSLVFYKNRLSFANDGGSMGSVPQPELPIEPMAAGPGIFTQAARIVADIKNNPNYTEQIGADLGIIGEETITQDPSLLKPTLKVKIGTGGHPQLSWVKKGADFTNVYVDRGEGSVFLRSVKGNKFTDMYALPSGNAVPAPSGPTTGTPASGAAVWRYRIVYVKNDAETGAYSDPVSIAVGEI